jgi:phosphoglucosamine mutase
MKAKTAARAAKATETPPVERKLFGTDGVRGAANEPPMTSEMALRLGQAIAFVAKRGKTRPVRIVIGKDTRLSGYMFETALASGICAMGGRVMLCGPVPTPAVAQLAQSMRADAGVVISASHNPFQDNGIKIFGPDGFKLPDALEHEIERLMEGTVLDEARVTGKAVGSAIKIEDARGRYVVFCKSTFPNRLSLDGLRIVVDAAHGAAYRVAPAVFSELGADVVALGVKPNGRNINRACGAQHPEHVREEVLRRGATLGIALDGDADRVIMVDERGQVVDGDAVLALCAKQMLDRGALPKKTVVATVMSNLGLERALQRSGGRLLRTAVGDRYVVEAMRAGGYRFGGEQSGHLVFLDHATTGDGIVAALQVLAAMLEQDKPLSELADGAMERVPQVLENAVFPRRVPLEQLKRTTAAIKRIEKALGSNGRILVRWSGTEPKLRVMLEGEDERLISTWAREIVGVARAELS